MKSSLVLLIFTLVGYLPLAAQDELCADVTSTPLNSIRLLEEQKDTRQSPCISEIINQLGKSREIRAVNVLVGYLDFVDPATRPKPNGFSDRRPVYPAVDALFQIGKVAAGALLEVIAGGKSPIRRHNATAAYQAIFRDDLAAGIRLVRNEASESPSPEARRRLREMMETLADDCRGRSEEEARACNAAAQGD